MPASRFATAWLVGALCAGALAPAAASPLLPPGTHVSGGIGEEDQHRMQLSRSLYNLRLTFAEAGTGAYLSGVDVVVEPVERGRTHGPFKDCGPLLYVALNPGAYRVRATYRGLARTINVHIGREAVTATLYWPILPD
ncbi:hypothetical protein [Variovorax sp. HW608]|uniref:hypothetical protein n=1 Tax=Variovorax sp. HW608 TaxID=1034889 RepID=UPI000B5AE483|nr:hypothetical protein [Variovorax sp. HW608]